MNLYVQIKGNRMEDTTLAAQNVLSSLGFAMEEIKVKKTESIYLLEEKEERPCFILNNRIGFFDLEDYLLDLGYIQFLSKKNNCMIWLKIEEENELYENRIFDKGLEIQDIDRLACFSEEV